MKSGKVQLKLENGKLVAVNLSQLSSADQEYLADHFGKGGDAVAAAGATAEGSGAECVTGGLAQPIGQVVGPIDGGGGSTYFLYIPKNLRVDRKAPLLHFNGAGGGSAGSIKPYIEGAEINGWIVAASVQSKNGIDNAICSKHAQNDVEHVIGTLPVDEERVYFTGGSGGGAMSFYNAAHIKSAGAMPHIGYIPDSTQLKSGHFFVINGTTDYNRYLSAAAVDSLGKDAIHRFHVGGHKMGPEWLCTEGAVWLNGRYLEKNSGDRKLAAERLDYEAAVIKWIGKLRESEAHRAYYWCVFLKDDYKISGPGAEALAPVMAGLAADPACVKYVEGIEDLSDFSEKYYAEFNNGSQFKHTTPRITGAAEKLAEKYAGTPMIEDLANELGKPTVGK